jgi:hypothetical protein
MDLAIRNKVDKCFRLVRQLPVKTFNPHSRDLPPITELKIGSVIRIEDDIFLITDKYQYYKKKKDELDGEEYQLTNPLTGEVKYLEYSIGDELEMYITTHKFSQRDIDDMLDSDGVNEEDYLYVKNGIREIECPINGEFYYYDEAWKNRFVKEGKTLEDADVVKMVEFEADNELTYITFEFWSDGLEAYMSEEIEDYHIQILAL